MSTLPAGVEHRAKIAVIGAGFAGLGVAEALKRHGIAYDQFDRNRRLGGVWHDGAYAGVHLITSKRSTGYDGFAMPAEFPDFPSGAQVLRYLDTFAQRHDLLAGLQLGTAVSAVRPVDGGTHWLVTFGDGTQRLYDGVVAATGHHWLPRVPAHEGRFDGEQLHSSDFKTPRSLHGKRVLVVGGGNSAADIAAAAAHHAASAHISMRQGHWILPKIIFGRPIGELLKGWLPLWLLRLLVRAVLGVAVGDYRGYGLQRPEHALFDQDPTISDQLLHHLRHGRITAHPGIRRLCGSEVEFVDGRRERFDLICWATGFHVALPYLGADVVEVRDGIPQTVAGMFARRHRNLYVFGIGHAIRPIPRYGVGPTISAGAELLALAIRAQARCGAPLGTLLGKVRDKPEQQFSNDPTRALLLVRLASRLTAGWLGRPAGSVRREPAEVDVQTRPASTGS